MEDKVSMAGVNKPYMTTFQTWGRNNKQEVISDATSLNTGKLVTRYDLHVISSLSLLALGRFQVLHQLVRGVADVALKGVRGSRM